MAMASVVGLIALPVILVGILLPVAAVVALQVWLCRRKNRWLGLILPGLSFLCSLLLVFNAAAFGGLARGGASLTVTEDGQVVEHRETEDGVTTVYDGEGNILKQYGERTQGDGLSLKTGLLAGVVFLVSNIPTVVLGGIWLYYKNHRDFRDEMKRMNIQDLE